MTTNRLAEETSPYLLQHKDNPVHWSPWTEEAFARARTEDKPVLLSIGYAACHWCHVMAHESFEDPATAALMNENFISIKVDREERPDVDKIYMDSLHALGEQGGWPLTMFLRPDGVPFWGGTYFPKESKFGRPSFSYVLEEIARIWRDERAKVDANGQAISAALSRRAGETAFPGEHMLLSLAETILGAVDMAHGGLKGAPKFPQTQLFEFLWRIHLRSERRDIADAVTITLTNLCQGGIYDHLAGGFARYSVDQRWLVPHFEKMLYDNALIVSLLSQVHNTSPSSLFRARIEETVDWMLSDMRNEGAFAASYDADSEGEEGRYYVWTEAEIRKLLDPSAFKLLATTYDVVPEGNWEGHAILNRLSSREPLSPEQEKTLAAARATLLDARRRRVKPGFDDKVLADWNGLAISALVDASTVLSRPDWLAAATDAFASILSTHWVGGALHHSWRTGVLRNLATVDGYANLIAAGLRLAAATGDRHHVETATALADAAIAALWDDDRGTFYFSSAQKPALVLRAHYGHDDAQPNGNAIMARNLLRLHLLTGREDYRRMSDGILDAYGGSAAANPFAYGSLLSSLEDRFFLLQAIVVSPEAGDEEGIKTARDEIKRLPVIDPLVMEGQGTAALPPLHPAHGKTAISGRVTTYLCRSTRCSLPAVDAAGIREAFASLA